MIRPDDRVGQAPTKRQKTMHEQFVPQEPLPTTEIVLNATDQIYFFENPIIRDNAWNGVLYTEPPQEDINKLLEEFALEPIPCVQRNVVLPSGVPPPPVNYFSETIAIPPELPVSILWQLKIFFIRCPMVEYKKVYWHGVYLKLDLVSDRTLGVGGCF
ncbi:hypothetical protein AVEN_192633-1 [Araneus ventricosus]|uniref:Uncharacterized protein n=1 Tax=Araneus ventricosus TaxID=182803 RepID=A0A4Y2IRL8_ARAVE|nr:hypothetical protein AVEN_192633-1 [Araneus ventricosus]